MIHKITAKFENIDTAEAAVRGIGETERGIYAVRILQRTVADDNTFHGVSPVPSLDLKSLSAERSTQNGFYLVLQQYRDTNLPDADFERDHSVELEVYCNTGAVSSVSARLCNLHGLEIHTGIISQ